MFAWCADLYLMSLTVLKDGSLVIGTKCGTIEILMKPKLIYMSVIRRKSATVSVRTDLVP